METYTYTYEHVSTYSKPVFTVTTRSVSSAPKKQSTRKNKFKGHDWSRRGSKKQRSAVRQTRKVQWFYAVAVGHRQEGIYLHWDDVKPAITGLRVSVHRGIPSNRSPDRYGNGEGTSRPITKRWKGRRRRSHSRRLAHAGDILQASAPSWAWRSMPDTRGRNFRQETQCQTGDKVLELGRKACSRNSLSIPRSFFSTE